MTKIDQRLEQSLSERLFDEGWMYTYIEAYATVHGMQQTLIALPYARQQHEGQVRRGREHVPYIYHPLLVAYHAIAIGLDDDNLISAALLHDVCEDCQIRVDELPVNEEVRKVVGLLTKERHRDEDKDVALDLYLSKISENGIALMVKLLDRCNNISGMAAGFSREKMVRYIKETEEKFYPLLEKAKQKHPEHSHRLFLIEYHMRSVIFTVRHLI